MKRVKGFLKHCADCGLVHDSKGAPDAACRAWSASLRNGNHGVTSQRWDRLLEEVYR